MAKPQERRTGLPGSWSEVYDRLAYLLGDRETAVEWVRQALEQTWGVLDPLDLERGRRGLALQKASGVLLKLEEEPGDLMFVIDVRQVCARVFAMYFQGVVLDGPPWRLSPTEDDRPSYAEWVGESDFNKMEVQQR